MVPLVCLQRVIVPFPGHTHLFFMHLNICTYICLPETLIYQRIHSLNMYLLSDSQKHMPPEDKKSKKIILNTFN